MANVRKKISELTALTSASLDTTVLGVDGGTTYKIELDTLADAVTSRVNILDRSRLSSLESVTSSFEIKGNSIISSSAQITALGFISSSQSINTGSLLSTSSFNSFSASVNSEILAATNEQSLLHLVTTSSFNSYTASISTGSLVNRLNTIENISGSWITENETGSFLTSLNGAISSSSQLTSSYDARYVLSGSITQTTWDNISGKPAGIVSQSTDLSSLNLFTQSIDGRVDNLELNTSSYLTSLDGAISSSSQLTSSFDTRYTLSGSVQPLPDGLISGSSQLTASYDIRYALSGSGGSTTIPAGTVSGSSQLTSSYDTRYLTIGGDGVISGSSQITGIVNLTNLSATSQVSASTFVGGFGVAESKYTVISSKPITFWPNITFESVRFTTAGGVIIGKNGETNDFGNKLDVSGSVRFIGNTTITGSLVVTNGITGSIAATNGIISGSSQLTSSYDTRYALSGSGGTISGGTISGSAQITTLGFATTSSLNTLTASFNSFTASAQAVTTGSNSFNGTQTITGSLIITTGSFVGSQILANTSSLYLTSGSNMYVQNNGVVEITGSLKVSGSANFNVNVLSVDGRSGDEGGEINLAIPVTNTTLENRVTTDVWQNRYRIFEGSANAKGVFVDLSKAPAGVGGELTWKASGLVNTGVDVTLGDLKARIPSTGNKSLQLSTTTGVTYSVYGSGIYTQAGSTVGTTINASSPLSVTSTPAYLASGYNFGTAGATDTWVIMDTSNTIAWRITMILGSGFNNNMISIERLV